MTNNANTYFQTMQKTAAEYEQARRERQSELDILREKGDEAALDAWYEREKSIEFPFNDGQNRACRAWVESTKAGSNTFEVKDLPWDKDIHDFVETLRAAGITEFAVTDKSTALMDSLHLLADEGCTMLGLCKVTRNESRWGSNGTETYNGILFRL